MPQAPELCDYYDHASNTFDFVKYFEDDDVYIKESTAKRIRQKNGDEKPVYTRNRCPRKEYRSCYWWKDYVIDEEGLYRNPNDRNGKTFRQRFGVDRDKVSSFCTVHYITLFQFMCLPLII